MWAVLGDRRVGPRWMSGPMPTLRFPRSRPGWTLRWTEMHDEKSSITPTTTILRSNPSRSHDPIVAGKSQAAVHTMHPRA
jgi:hypothetical protein